MEPPTYENAHVDEESWQSKTERQVAFLIFITEILGYAVGMVLDQERSNS